MHAHARMGDGLLLVLVRLCGQACDSMRALRF